jgi:hypothetical protein
VPPSKATSVMLSRDQRRSDHTFGYPDLPAHKPPWKSLSMVVQWIRPEIARVLGRTNLTHHRADQSIRSMNLTGIHTTAFQPNQIGRPEAPTNQLVGRQKCCAPLLNSCAQGLRPAVEPCLADPAELRSTFRHRIEEIRRDAAKAELFEENFPT